MSNSKAIVPHTGMEMQCPVDLSLKRGEVEWTLPLEPTVSVSGGATIIRRQVNSALGRVGTVKEEWSQDDAQISVSGLLQGLNGEYPEDEVAKLLRMLTSGTALQIRCLLLDTLGITQMVVERWEFPHTPGVENQTYTFSGYADSDFELLI